MRSICFLVLLYATIGVVTGSSPFIQNSLINKICHLNQEENKMNCTELNLKHQCGFSFCALDESNCKKFQTKKLNQRIYSVSECRYEEEISKPGEKPFYGNTVWYLNASNFIYF